MSENFLNDVYFGNSPEKIALIIIDCSRYEDLIILKYQ